MKTIAKLVFTLTLLIGFGGLAQIKPEQQKEIEAAQKKAMEEAMNNMEEMMENNPQMKKLKEQLITQDAQKKAERKKNDAVAEKENAQKKAEHMEKFYWRNKVASDTNGKFAKWKWGDVNIGYYDGDKRRDQEGNYIDKKYVVLGRISSSGVVTMNLHANVKTNRIISNGLFPQMYGEHNEEVTFSNPDTPFLWTNFTLEVIKEGKQIGSLYIGNSERTTQNMSWPSMINYGDEGYLLYWAYSGGACMATANKIQKDVSLTVGESETKLDRQVTVDLAFTTGWNLIKISVDESTHQIGQKWFTKKTYTSVPSMPADAKYYFKLK